MWYVWRYGSNCVRAFHFVFNLHNAFDIFHADHFWSLIMHENERISYLRAYSFNWLIAPLELIHECGSCKLQSPNPIDIISRAICLHMFRSLRSPRTKTTTTTPTTAKKYDMTDKSVIPNGTDWYSWLHSRDTLKYLWILCCGKYFRYIYINCIYAMWLITRFISSCIWPQPSSLVT